MTSQPNLLTLTRGSTATQVSPPPRRWLLRVGLPIIIIAAVAALLLYTARDALVPAVEVNVAPVVAIANNGPAPSGAAPQVLVQAPGWVEADPYAITVPALTAGVVKEVLVLEGEHVEKDQVVATLIDEDAQLAKKRSASELQVMQAELAMARAAHAAALNRTAEVRDEVERKRGLVDAGGVSEGQFARLELRLRAMEQELEAAHAAVLAAEARVRQHVVACEEADLALERTRVRAPASGVVLARLVEPGARVGMDGPAILRLYNPAKLQVRVDVPIAEAAKVGVGTPANVVTEALPDVVFKGEVTRIVHEADIQRNTVQVKVALHDPSPTLKPEMLTRVRFMGTPQSGAASSAAASEQARRVLVPAQSVIQEGEGKGRVFIVDQSHAAGPVAASRSITFTPAQEGLVQATGDLREGDRVIIEPLEGLKDGQRIRVAGKGAR